MVRFGVVVFLASSGSVKPPDAGKMGLEGNKNMGCLERDRGVCFFYYLPIICISFDFIVTEQKKKRKKENVCPSIHYSLFPGGYFIKPGHFSYASLSRQIFSFSFSS